MKHRIHLVAAVSMAILLFVPCLRDPTSAAQASRRRSRVSRSAGSRDPTSAARALLEEECKKRSNGYLKLTKFVKHDAVAEIINGVDYYTVSYTIEAEGLKDGGYLHLCQYHRTKYDPLLSFEVSEQANPDACFDFPVEKGHRYQFDQSGFLTSPLNTKMKIAKHESGWVIVR